MLLSWTELKNKKIGVVGFGKTGQAVHRQLRHRNIPVFVSDSQIRTLPPGVRGETKIHTDQLLECGLIIVSPGVDWQLPILKRARHQGIPVWGEIEWAYRVLECEGRLPQKTIVITGTNGKTTTTSLIGHILRSAQKPIIVGGNIGTPFSSLLNKIENRTWLVLELSSYQLETIEKFRADVGVLLNITPDHLGRHGTMNRYAQAKWKIFKKMIKNDVGVFNADDARCQKLSRHFAGVKLLFSSRISVDSGASLTHRRIWFNDGRRHYSLAPPTSLMGTHNIENAMAALCATSVVNISQRVIDKAFQSFKGVEHRMERVLKKGSVCFINDSKATNVDSTRVALEALRGTIHLIMGGQDKGNSYRPLAPLLQGKVKNLLLIGESAQKIKKQLGHDVNTVLCKTLSRAVSYAHRVAQRNDIVLLSPGCASFDQFQNFEARGKRFKKMIQQLKVE